MVKRIPLIGLIVLLLLSLPLTGTGQSREKARDYRTRLENSPVLRSDQNGSKTQKTDDSENRVRLEDFHYVPPSDSLTGNTGGKGISHAIRTKPGIALLSSAIIPGSGQLINHKYLRGALYAAVEAASIIIHLSEQNEAERQEARYKQFANSNWSVEKYAIWLVNYNDAHGLTGEALDELRNQVGDIQKIEYGKKAWHDDVALSTLHNVEKSTPFVYTDGTVGNDFSHTLPDFGSQQYYELISKYYQFGPGWRDFDMNTYKLHWDGRDMPSNWSKGARLAQQFNDSYKLSGNMLKLTVVNHVISAFDAFFTVKLKQHKLNANATLLRGGGGLASVSYSF